MSGYDTTSDVESGVVRYISGLDLWSVHKMSIVFGRNTCAGEAGIEEARCFTAISWGIYERLWHTGSFPFAECTETAFLEWCRVLRRRASNNFKSTKRCPGTFCLSWFLLCCSCWPLLHIQVFAQFLPLYFASFSNVMVKYVPEVSSWQLLFVRCSMQVKYSIGNRWK